MADTPQASQERCADAQSLIQSPQKQSPPTKRGWEKRLTEEQLKAYLDKGGKVTVCPPGARTENIDFKGGFYGRKPTKKEEEQQ